MSGQRIDKNIVSEADYFFYHLFRILEARIKTNFRISVRLNLPPDSPKFDLSDSSIDSPSSVRSRRSSCVEFSQDRITPRLSRGSPRGGESAILRKAGSYADNTGYKSQIRFGEICDIVDQYVTMASETGPTEEILRKIAGSIKLIIAGDLSQYYYNYRPLSKSVLGVALAHELNWHWSWFKVPDAYFHINEWGYLIDHGVPLFDYAHDFIVVDGLRRDPCCYLVYFLDNLRYDKSGAVLTEKEILHGLSATQISNIVAKEIVEKYNQIAPKFVPGSSEAQILENLRNQLRFFLPGKLASPGNEVVTSSHREHDRLLW